MGTLGQVTLLVLTVLPCGVARAQVDSARLCELPWTLRTDLVPVQDGESCRLVSASGYEIEARPTYRSWPVQPVHEPIGCGESAAAPRTSDWGTRITEATCEPMRITALLEHPDGLLLRVEVSAAGTAAQDRAREVMRTIRPEPATRTSSREVVLPGQLGTLRVPRHTVAVRRETPHGEALSLHPTTPFGQEPATEVYFTTDLGAALGPGEDCWAPLGSRSFRGALSRRGGSVACDTEVTLGLDDGAAHPVAFGWRGPTSEAPAWARAVLQSVEPASRIYGDERATGWHAPALALALGGFAALAGWVAWRWRAGTG